MNKLTSVLNWCKKHKIITVIIIVFIAIGTIANSNSTKPTTTTTKTTQTKQTTPQLSYTVTEDKGTVVGVVVPASYDNVGTMKQLGTQLKQKYDTSSRSHVFVYVFDDKSAASLLDTVLAGNDTSAQDATYDPHFVAEYQKNAPTNFNQFTIQINGGVNDNNPTTIKY